MRRFPQPLAALAFFVAVPLAAHAQSAAPVDAVSPLVGTQSTYALSYGNVYPAIARPFGMTAWTPQTGNGGWTYGYADTHLQGFRATHQPSPWMGDYGRLTIAPMTGRPIADADARASAFTHCTETSHPYLYRVHLDRYGIGAEVTATPRAGLLRFAFSTADSAFVVFDAFDRGAEISFDAARQRVEGFTRSNSGGVPDGFALYFTVDVSRPFTASGAWTDGQRRDGAGPFAGQKVQGFLGFAARPGDTLELRVGTSFISPEQARLNLEKEVGSHSFSEVVAESRAAWNDELGRIEIEGATSAQRTVFYTALYRTLLFPRMFYEYDTAGQPHYYSPYDGQVHAGVMYTDNGFWDTFRAVYPFFTLMYPDRDAEIIRGLVAAYREGGWLPKWMSPGYRNVMIGTHTASVIADAYRKGIRDFDAETAYQAMRKDAMDEGGGNGRGREGIALYKTLGYVPTDRVHEATARTLEFAYGDWCVAQMARALGHDDDAQLFFSRSMNYRHVFDGSVGFMRGRLESGAWRPHFDATEWGGPFTEGSAWHYTWSVMHDPLGLAGLMGGRAPFAHLMDSVFATPGTFNVGAYRGVIHEMTEMTLGGMGQYAHGNQPIQHMIYLYNWAGQPWKTQYWAREAMNRLYKPTPDGLPGDEDQGQTSVWYVFSALGFYPVAPGEPYYALGAPLFTRARLHLPGGKTLTIEAPDNSARNRYVRGVRLDGQPIARNWLGHDELMAGGTLHFDMGAAPDSSWGSSPESAPYSLSNTLAAAMPFVAAPDDADVSPGGAVTLATTTRGAAIHYTLDGTEPGTLSPRYSAPVRLLSGSRLRARAFHPGLAPSLVFALDVP